MTRNSPTRAARAAVAAGLSLLLAAQVAGAAAPATGSWAVLGNAAAGPFGGAAGTVEGARLGPDGRVYVYGQFLNAGGDPTADNLFAYDPATGAIAGIGSNGGGDGALQGRVYDVAWVNGVLYAGGGFANAGGAPGANYVAAWNGTSWTKRGSINMTVLALATVGGYLYAGGAFTNAGGDSWADYLARWDGYAWVHVGSNGVLSPAFEDNVTGLAATPDGHLYAVGDFTNAGGDVNADNLAVWDPVTALWSAVGGVPSGSFSSVEAVAVAGSRVIIGGAFDNLMGNPLLDNIAEWTGSAWVAYGSNGAGSGALDGPVHGLAVYGSNVLAAGSFSAIAGVAGSSYIAAWNGAKWLATGNPTFAAGYPYGVAVGGRALYAFGSFADLAGLPGADSVGAYGLPAPPSVPRTLAGISGSKRVTLSWKAPATANGASIRDYVVQYRKVGTTAWTTYADGVKTTRTAIVKGLKSGTWYQFRVLAKNDWGVGGASTAIKRKAY